MLNSPSSGQWIGAQSPPPSAAATTAARQGRQEETYSAHVQWPTDLCTGEDLRADQVLGWTGARQISLRLRDERVPSQSKYTLNHIIRIRVQDSSHVRHIRDATDQS